MTRTPVCHAVFSSEEDAVAITFQVDDDIFILPEAVTIKSGVDYVAIGYSDGTGSITADAADKSKRLH